MAFSLFVTVYLGAFHAFSMYGSLTTLAIVMFWLYFSMYIIMIGAEVNEVMRQDRENKDS
jgi:membrane protein